MTEVKVSGHLLAVPTDFIISRARIRFSHHLLVQLEVEGATGVGEGVLYRTLPQQAASLFQRLVRPRLERDGLPGDEGAQREWISDLAVASPALAYAVDTALWDLRGKEIGQPVADLLGGRDGGQAISPGMRIPVTEQVFVRDWPTAERELAAILSRGTRRIKVKIGVAPRTDLETVRRVRAFVGPRVKIRVDVNRGYTLAEGEALYRALTDLGVEALEEPLSDGGWSSSRSDVHDLRALRGRLGLPVILDESILSLADLRAAIAEEAIDILNIKLTRVGGTSRALLYADICRQHGVQIVIGCSEDLGVGTAAITHLAAALPEVHSVEGLGPQRLGFDVIAEEWALKDGRLTLPEGPGLGVTLPRDWTDRLPRGVRWFDLSEGSWQLSLFSHYARWFQRANNVLWRVRRRSRTWRSQMRA